MAKQVVGSMSDWSGMLMDLHRQIHDGSIEKHHLQAFLEHREAFANGVQVAVGPIRLLAKMASVAVPDVKEFVLTEDFLLNKCGVRKEWIGDNFRKHFIDKKCSAVSAGSLAAHLLQKNSPDKPIMEELGEKHQTTMGQFVWLLQQQSQGQEGVLLTNGYANIFYIVDDEGVTWAVCAHWYSRIRAWNVYASSVEDPSGWCAGSQVFSRDS